MARLAWRNHEHHGLSPQIGDVPLACAEGARLRKFRAADAARVHRVPGTATGGTGPGLS